MKSIKDLNTLSNLTYDLAALAGLLESVDGIGAKLFTATELDNIMITLERGMNTTAWAAKNLPDLDPKSPEGKVFMRTLLLRAVRNIDEALTKAE